MNTEQHHRLQVVQANLCSVQAVAELMQISAEQRSMAVQQLQRFSANRQSAVDLTRYVPW